MTANIRHVPAEQKSDLLAQGFMPGPRKWCYDCDEQGTAPAQHGDILAKYNDNNWPTEIVVLWNGAPSAFDILVIMESVGSALSLRSHHLVSLAHKRLTAPGSVKLHEYGVFGPALLWFESTQDKTLRGAEAYHAGAELWRRYFDGKVPDDEIDACVAKDESARAAIASLEVEQVSDNVVFTSTRIDRMYEWHRKQGGNSAPVVVTHNPNHGTVTVHTAAGVDAVKLFGQAGLQALQRHLDRRWDYYGANRLYSRTLNGVPEHRFSLEDAREVAVVIAGVVSGLSVVSE